MNKTDRDKILQWLEVSLENTISSMRQDPDLNHSVAATYLSGFVNGVVTMLRNSCVVSAKESDRLIDKYQLYILDRL